MSVGGAYSLRTLGQKLGSACKGFMAHQLLPWGPACPPGMPQCSSTPSPSVTDPLPLPSLPCFLPKACALCLLSCFLHVVPCLILLLCFLPYLHCATCPSSITKGKQPEEQSRSCLCGRSTKIATTAVAADCNTAIGSTAVSTGPGVAWLSRKWSCLSMPLACPLPDLPCVSH